LNSAPNRSTCPRLSEAARFLADVRRHLAAQSIECPVAVTVHVRAIDEDGLFGYELLTERETHTSIAAGRTAAGRCVLRKTTYGDGARGSIRLASVNGRLVSPSNRVSRYHVQRRDYPFPDLRSTARAAWTELQRLFPDRPEANGSVYENVQGLEESLAIASTRLAGWDPFVDFFGLPNEAQMGYVLAASAGERGLLSLQHSNTWTLQWTAISGSLVNSWTLADVHPNACDDMNQEAGLHNRRVVARRLVERNQRWAGEERRQTRDRRTRNR